MEWTDPRYADVVAALRQARRDRPARPDGTHADRAVRGFIVPTGPARPSDAR